MNEVILIAFPKTKEFELEVLNTWSCVKYVNRLNVHFITWFAILREVWFET